MNGGCEWRHAPEACAEDLGEFEKSHLVEFCLGGRRLTFARSPRPCSRCRTSFGAEGKVSIERWYLSPYVEKPFNSKVIKSFETELRSRKCFLYFGIPMLYICYIWTFYEYYMYVSHIHVHRYIYIEELWYNETVCLWMTIYTVPHESWALWRRNLRLPLA